MATVVIRDHKTITTGNIKQVNHPVVSVDGLSGSVKVSQVLPFRVRFTTIGVASTSNADVLPIGIAIIGYNNYIL